MKTLICFLCFSVVSTMAAIIRDNIKLKRIVRNAQTFDVLYNHGYPLEQAFQLDLPYGQGPIYEDGLRNSHQVYPSLQFHQQKSGYSSPYSPEFQQQPINQPPQFYQPYQTGVLLPQGSQVPYVFNRPLNNQQPTLNLPIPNLLWQMPNRQI